MARKTKFVMVGETKVFHHFCIDAIRLYEQMASKDGFQYMLSSEAEIGWIGTIALSVPGKSNTPA